MEVEDGWVATRELCRFLTCKMLIGNICLNKKRSDDLNWNPLLGLCGECDEQIPHCSSAVISFDLNNNMTRVYQSCIQSNSPKQLPRV